MFAWHLALRNQKMMPGIDTLATKWCIDL